MVGFALSCFGLVLFLWLAFGGPVPLKPKGYRVSASFAEARSSPTRPTCGSPASRSARSRRSSRTPRPGRSLVTIELDAKYAPLPADAQAILRQKTLLGETYVELTPGTERRGDAPRGRRAAAGAGRPRRSSSTRSCARSTPRRARRSRSGCRRRPRRSTGHGRDVNDAFGNLGPFAEDATELRRHPRPQEPAVQRLISDTGVVFEALTERDGQLRGLIENSNTVFATTADARPRAAGDVRRAADVRARVARRRVDRLDRSSRATPTRS